MSKGKGSLILLVGIVLILKIGANLIRLYKSGDRLVEAKKELAMVQQENKRLQGEWEKVQTPEYMEREAREKLGYGKPGEVVVVIPEEELKKTKPLEAKQTIEAANWERWRKLYLGW